MPSHFSSLGMPITNEQEYAAMVKRVIDAAKPIELENGTFLRYAAPSGVEFWLLANRRKEILTFSPHFAGPSRSQVGIVDIIRRGEHDSHDVGLYAWANPKDGDPKSGDYPFVFDVPNLDLFAPIRPPILATVQITAFANEITLYESEESFSAADSSMPQLASRSFIPIGTFPINPEEGSAMHATALFAGHVLQHERRINELTGLPFHWISVETLGCTFDVVADPELISGTPQAGNIVMGTFWLSGYLVDLPFREPGKRKIWDFLAWGRKPN